MKTYRHVFFDVDDTLLDFAAGEHLALRLLFEEQGIPLTAEILARYRQINHGLWRAYEVGTIERDEVLNSRHSLLFKELGYEVDGSSLETVFRGYLEQQHQLVSGAFDLLTKLHDAYPLYVVSNGVAGIQYPRLHASGLHGYFKGIFISEETGFRKPMKEFFDYVFARIPDVSAETSLIVGDSLSADILGGLRAGMDTCWFNPDGKPNDSDLTPTYQIAELGELPLLLKKLGSPNAEPDQEGISASASSLTP